MWKARNEAVFQLQEGQVEGLLRAAECMVQNIWEVNCRRGIQDVSRIVDKAWRPPEVGWVKVNTDGAAGLKEDWSTVGGAVRDSAGGWLLGFQRYLGHGSALNAKMWGMLHGLQVAAAPGYDKVILESDCLLAVQMVNQCLQGSPSATIARHI